MKTRNLILALIGFIIASVSIALCFKVYVLDKNFQILTITSCDETSETCFAFVCDSTSEEYPSEMCRETADNDTLFYTYIFKKKSMTPDCDATKGVCEPLVCAPNEEGCERVVCSEETLAREFVPEGAECSIYIPPAAPAQVEEEKPEPAPQPEPMSDTDPYEGESVPTGEPLPPQSQVAPTDTTVTTPQPQPTTKPDAPLYDPNIIDTSL